MEHFVNLHSLPEGLRFPADLQARIRFDAERKRLVYQGQMWKAHYDRLVALHLDADYQLAIEQLFRISAEPTVPPRRRLKSTVAIACVVGGTLFVGMWWYATRASATPSTSPTAAPSDRMAIAPGATLEEK